MALVHLVRHGEAAAGFGEDHDPGLSARGTEQALAVAAALAPSGPLPIVVSPLTRCRETAAVLAERWAVEPVVDARVGEIVAPDPDLALRTAWLRRALGGTWGDLEDTHGQWRATVLDALGSIERETVVFTHFVAINVAVGAATDRPDVVCFTPDNCSVTVLANDGGALSLVSLGAERETNVSPG